MRSIFRPTVYRLLVQACGLSQGEAADFHDVRLDTVKSWSSGRNAANSGVLRELRRLYLGIAAAGHQLAGKIEVAAKENEPVMVGVVETDRQAMSLGFPCAGAHAAAIGIALANLPDGTLVDLAPHRPGILTATSGTP